MTRKQQEIIKKRDLEKITQRAKRFASLLNDMYQSETSKSEKNRMKTEGLPLCVFNESSQLFEPNYEYIKVSCNRFFATYYNQTTICQIG